MNRVAGIVPTGWDGPERISSLGAVREALLGCPSPGSPGARWLLRAGASYCPRESAMGSDNARAIRGRAQV